MATKRSGIRLSSGPRISFDFLQNERNKNDQRLKKLQETLDTAKDADKYRIQGELLTTYMHQFSRGDRSQR